MARSVVALGITLLLVRGAVAETRLVSNEVRRMSGQSGAIFGIDLSSDGRLVAAGGIEGVVRVFDVHTGKLQREFRGHNEMVIEMAFSPSGQHLASVSRDNTARIWDVATGEAAHVLHHNSDPVRVIFTPDGRELLTAAVRPHTKIWRWDPVAGKELPAFALSQFFSEAIAASVDSQCVFVGMQNNDPTNRGRVEVRELATQKIISTTPVPQGIFKRLAASRDGRFLAAGHGDSTASVFSIDNQRTVKLLRSFVGHAGQVESVAFSPDGKLLATGSVDATARVWDVETGAELALFTGHNATVHDIAFIPDSTLMVSGSQDASLLVWDRGGVPAGTHKMGTTIAAVSSPAPSSPAPPMVPTMPEVRAPARASDGKFPLPDQAAMETARARVKEIYESDYQVARSAALRATLAEKLQLAAKDVVAGSANHLVLLRESCSLAAQAGDSTLAIAGVEQLSTDFQVPHHTLLIELLPDTLRAARNMKDRLQIGLTAFEAATKAHEAEELEVARDLIEIANRAARAARDETLIDKTTAIEAWIKAQILARPNAIAAQKLLQFRPDDPAANLAWGRYLCFYCWKFEDGLDHLKKCNDLNFREVAMAERPDATRIYSPMSKANAWWALIDKTRGVERITSQASAKYWFELAIVGAPDFVRDAIVLKLESLKNLPRERR